MVISGDPDSHTTFRAFGSEAVTTCFNDLGQSRPEIEPESPACDTNALLYTTAVVILILHCRIYDRFKLLTTLKLSVCDTYLTLYV